MSLYSYVATTVDNLQTGEFITIDIPDKLKAFRKFLSEIARKDHKKFITKVRDNKLHIMRIVYHSIVEKLENE